LIQDFVMVKMRALLFLAIFTFSLPLQRQIIAFPVISDDIVAPFSSGSSSGVARFFDNGLGMNINGIKGDYSKNQAELLLRDFFKQYPPSHFEVIRKGSITDHVTYFLANYHSSKSKFRILVQGTNQDQRIRIFSLDIIKQ
jgi:hypothetical protein